MKYEFDPKHRITSWGYVKCECGAESNDINVFLKQHSCSFSSEGNNGNITYCFGPKEVEDVKKSENGRSRCGRLTKQVLEAQFLELLE